MEIAYIPCLSYPAGEMKHGPIALLEEGTPVVVIVPNDKHKKKTIASILLYLLRHLQPLHLNTIQLPDISIHRYQFR